MLMLSICPLSPRYIELSVRGKHSNIDIKIQNIGVVCRPRTVQVGLFTVVPPNTTKNGNERSHIL